MTYRAATRFVVVLALALGVSGCKSKCRQLSEKQCDCAINSSARTSCLQTVSGMESNTTLSPNEEAYCATLIDKCDCRLVDTAQGKVNCGMAWPKDLPVTP